MKKKRLSMRQDQQLWQKFNQVTTDMGLTGNEVVIAFLYYVAGHEALPFDIDQAEKALKSVQAALFKTCAIEDIKKSHNVKVQLNQQIVETAQSWLTKQPYTVKNIVEWLMAETIKQQELPFNLEVMST